MNPALPLLLLLSSAGLLLRRREIGLPWAACGLAGMVLLAPALSLSDGIPSPAGALAEHAPWRGAADQATGGEAAGNPNLRDITYQVEPWLLFLRHELREGRLPYWDPYQFAGSPYWSNGSGAPLFPLHLLFALLPLQLGLVLLPWLRIVIGGCGAFLLARELGLSKQASLLAALAFPLSGMITGFLLFPMANCHALVPWVFLAVERLASGRGRWPALALAGGLQLLGGHPETPVFTALLAGIYLLVRSGVRGRLRVWAGFVGGWIVALALSAVQILPLFLTLRGTGKWLHAETGEPPPLATVGKLLLRLVLPDAFGHPAAGTWWGPYNWIGTAIYVGVLPLFLALGALFALRNKETTWDRRWVAIAVMTFCALVGAYHLPGARQLLLHLPVIQRGIHHYLKFGVELGLVLLAARGLEIWLAGGRARKAFLLSAIALCALLAAAWWGLGEEWRARGLVSAQTAWTASALAAILLPLAALFAPARWRAGLAFALLPLAALDLAVAHAPTNPGLPLARLYPRTGAVRFLEGRPERFAASGFNFHPDAAMVYRLYDVRGDSPVKLVRYDRVYGAFASPDPVYFRPIRDWSSLWLDRLGVRWVALAPEEEPPAGSGWRLAYDGADARVFERPTARPLVRLEGGAPGAHRAEVRVERREPGLWRLRISSPGRPLAAGARLVVAETWDPGWKGVVAGRPQRVEAEEGIFLGVPVPREGGTVELRYRPEGIGLGAALSLAALLAIALGGRRGALDGSAPGGGPGAAGRAGAPFPPGFASAISGTPPPPPAPRFP